MASTNGDRGGRVPSTDVAALVTGKRSEVSGPQVKQWKTRDLICIDSL